MRSRTVVSQTETVQQALAELPLEAAMQIRDVIRGLEAETGTARALLARSEVLARRDIAHATRRAETFRAERDEAAGALNLAREERDALGRRVEELNVQVALRRRRFRL